MWKKTVDLAFGYVIGFSLLPLPFFFFFPWVTLNLTGEQTVVSLVENEKFIMLFPKSVLHVFFSFLPSWNLQTVLAVELAGILASPGFNSGAFHGVKLPR